MVTATSWRLISADTGSWEVAQPLALGARHGDLSLELWTNHLVASERTLPNYSTNPPSPGAEQISS